MQRWLQCTFSIQMARVLMEWLFCCMWVPASWVGECPGEIGSFSLWRKPAALLCWLLSARRMFLFLLSATDWVECRGSKGRDGTVLIALQKGGRLGFEDEPGFWATSENKGITKRKKKRVGNVSWVTTILGPPRGVEDRPAFLQFCRDHSQVMRLRNSSPWIPKTKWLKSVQLRTQQIKKYFLFPLLSHCCQ